MFLLIFVFLQLSFFIQIETNQQNDFSGLYRLENCRCTNSLCPSVSSYSIFQNSNDDFVINFLGSTVGQGKIRQNQLTIEWISNFDFPQSCSAFWIDDQRTFQLKCEEQNRFCTGQLTCQPASGPCDQRKNKAVRNQIQILLFHFLLIFIQTIFN